MSKMVATCLWSVVLHCSIVGFIICCCASSTGCSGCFSLQRAKNSFLVASTDYGGFTKY